MRFPLPPSCSNISVVPFMVPSSAIHQGGICDVVRAFPKSPLPFKLAVLHECKNQNERDFGGCRNDIADLVISQQRRGNHAVADGHV